MAFGLIHWLVSFTIFLIVLTIITWSAVHLAAKSQNSTDFAVRFLDIKDYPVQEETKSFSPTVFVRDSNSRVIENTDGPTQFANHQGFEISDSAEFYKILEAISSMQNRAVSSTQDDSATTILASPTVGDDSMWSEDTASAVHEPSDKSPAPNNRSQGEVFGPPSNATLRATHPVTTYGARFFDVDRLPKSGSYRPVAMEFEDILEDKRDWTSNASIAFSYARVLSDLMHSDVTERTETTQSLRISRKNERLETTMISPYLHSTVRNITVNS